MLAWVIFNALLSSVDFFQINYFTKLFLQHSECQIRDVKFPNKLLALHVPFFLRDAVNEKSIIQIVKTHNILLANASGRVELYTPANGLEPDQEQRFVDLGPNWLQRASVHPLHLLLACNQKKCEFVILNQVQQVKLVTINRPHSYCLCALAKLSG